MEEAEPRRGAYSVPAAVTERHTLLVPRAQRARNVALTSFSVLVLGALRAPSEQGHFTNIWMAVRRLRLLPSIQSW